MVTVTSVEARKAALDVDGIALEDGNVPTMGRLGRAWRATVRFCENNAALLIGSVMLLVGMTLFNLGLSYGFTPLGNQTGLILPASYMRIRTEPESPYYSYGCVVVREIACLAARKHGVLDRCCLAIGHTNSE